MNIANKDEHRVIHYQETGGDRGTAETNQDKWRQSRWGWESQRRKIAGKKHLESKTGSNRMTERRRKRYTRGERDLQGNPWGDGYEIKAGTTLKIIILMIYQDRKRNKKPPKQNKNWNIISKYINRNLKHKTHDIQVNQILCKPSVLHKMTTASGISL